MEPTPVHGTAIAYAGCGCLILGKSGSGKSALAAEAILHGAKLVGDDQLVLTHQSGMLMAGAAKQISGIMALSGLGLIRMVDIMPRHVLHLVVELDQACTERLPEQQKRDYGGISIPYLRIPAVPRVSAGSLLLYLKAVQEGRTLPTDWRPVA